MSGASVTARSSASDVRRLSTSRCLGLLRESGAGRYALLDDDDEDGVAFLPVEYRRQDGRLFLHIPSSHGVIYGPREIAFAAHVAAASGSGQTTMVAVRGVIVPDQQGSRHDAVACPWGDPRPAGGWWEVSVSEVRGCITMSEGRQ
jgi:hypothetical protein